MFEQGIDYLFNEVSLYTKESFNVFELRENKYEYNQEEFFKFLYYIGIAQDKLITYCHKCKKEFPFNIQKQYFEFSGSGKYTTPYIYICKKVINLECLN